MSAFQAEEISGVGTEGGNGLEGARNRKKAMEQASSIAM